MSNSAESGRMVVGFYHSAEVGMSVKPLIYLACPYTHPDAEVRQSRFEAANRAAGKLMLEGHVVFSPISHCHDIAKVCDLPTDWEYWQNHCKTYLSCCYKLIVLRLPGWTSSKGVAEEIKIAKELGLDIESMEAV